MLPLTRINRIAVTLLLFAVCGSTATAQHAAFWLSPIEALGGGAQQPLNADDIPTIVRSTGDTTGTLFVWGQTFSTPPMPTAPHLANVTLKAVSSNPLLVFEAPLVFNPLIGATQMRWEHVFPEPMDGIAASTTTELKAFNLNIPAFGTGLSGLGLGATTDPQYDPAIDAWLVAALPYQLDGSEGSASISLQIGSNGINANDGIGFAPSGDTNVIFGAASDPPLNASTQRGLNSLTAEAIVQVVNTPSLPCDYVNTGNGCDINDLDALYAGSDGAPGPVGPVLIAQWLVDASQPDNPAKSDAADVYVIGDLNLNGDVNSTDLGILLNDFGNSGALQWGDGDIDASGTVDSTDLGALLNNFVITSALNSTVPESTNLLLFPVALGAILVCVRNRRHTSKGSNNAG